jgi:hypothetical protein
VQPAHFDSIQRGISNAPIFGYSTRRKDSRDLRVVNLNRAGAGGHATRRLWLLWAPECMCPGRAGKDKSWMILRQLWTPSFSGRLGAAGGPRLGGRPAAGAGSLRLISNARAVQVEFKFELLKAPGPSRPGPADRLRPARRGPCQGCSRHRLFSSVQACQCSASH